ncbi:hypothetical protein LIA77_02547 [Sarocladium implicatum]|nr:hypothetical protein LIA77_02547 [Sarocladium implicatum]
MPTVDGLEEMELAMLDSEDVLMESLRIPDGLRLGSGLDDGVKVGVSDKGNDANCGRCSPRSRTRNMYWTPKSIAAAGTQYLMLITPTVGPPSISPSSLFTSLCLSLLNCSPLQLRK